MSALSNPAGEQAISPLWAHQQHARGFVENLWEHGHRGAMLAIIMGGGKSRVAISLAADYRLSPILITSPLRVVEVWKRQFALYAPQYHFVALDDRIASVDEKTRLAKAAIGWGQSRNQPVAIAINYESAWRPSFSRFALRQLWALSIGDELHRAKDHTGRISRFMGQLGLVSRYRLGLTGTPMPHDPLDIWAQFRFLDRSVFDVTFASFKARYAIMGGFQGKQVMGFRFRDEINERFLSIAFRAGEEVLDLPPAIDEDCYADLGAEGARIYRSLERDFLAWLDSSDVVTVPNALVKLLRLQQLTGGAIPDDSETYHVVDTAKKELLTGLMEDIGPDEPVVVFCRFRADLEAVGRAAQKLGYLSGELSGARNNLAAWQQGGPSDPTVLAVQIQSGGVGIDLTRARYGIYYSLGFSLADYLQSRARIRRPGQTRPVAYYHLLARGTVDERVMRALERREELVESMIREYRTRR